ncbi:MAG: MFS transporter [Desulfurellaceae bacterium]|nr:MFS transporter [Desulfurellaceae bacterium]
MAWPVRYKLVGLLTTGSMINYLDRVNIAVAAPVMMEALGWGEDSFGVIFSAFLIGYTLLQFPGGVIADRWNACKLLAVVCVGFSLCIALGAPFLVGAVLVSSAGLSVACFTAYLFLVNIAGGGYWSIPLEFNPRLVGAISGVMNGSGNFAGIFGPMTAGFLIAQTGSWALPFLVAVSFVILYFLVIPDRIDIELPAADLAVRHTGV